MKGGDGQDSVFPEDSKASGHSWRCPTPVIQRPEERKPPVKGQLVPMLLLGPEHPQQSWVQQFSALPAYLQEGSSPQVLSDKASLSRSVPVFEPAGDSKIKPETSPVYLPALWCQHWSPDNDQDLPKLSCGIYQQLQKQLSSEWLLRPFICRDNQVKLWDQLHSAEEPPAQKKGWSSCKGEFPFRAASAFVHQSCVA